MTDRGGKRQRLMSQFVTKASTGPTAAAPTDSLDVDIDERNVEQMESATSSPDRHGTISPQDADDNPQSGSLESGESSKTVSATQFIRRLNFSINTKSMQWTQFFTYEGHNSSNGMGWRCRFDGCGELLSISSTSYFNAKRHYLGKHKIDLQAVQPKADKSPGSSFFEPSPSLLRKRLATQQKFDEGVLKLMAEDGVPMNLVEKRSFLEIVKILDPSVQVKSRRTYSRDLENMVSEKVAGLIKKIHQDNPSDSISYSLDIWTSIGGKSVLATRCHYLDDAWTLRTRTIGFQDFDDRHTGDNIRQKFEELLASYDSSIKDTHYVVTDSAANMVKAFNMVNVFEEQFRIVWSRGGAEVEADEELDEESADPDLAQSDDEDNANEDELAADVRPKFLRCLAHLLQLVVNKAMILDPPTVKVSKYLEKISEFFRRRSHWRSVLENKAKKQLMKPVKTRWNSLFFALNRLQEPGMLTAVAEVGRQIYRTDPKVHEKFPELPSDCVPENLKILLSLLQPIQEATDRLQTEKTSISLVILTILVAFEKISKIKAGKFLLLKTELLRGMKTRFEDEVVNKDVYILSSFLDPRCKDSIFKEPWFSDPVFEIKMQVPSAETLKSLLDFNMQLLKMKNLFVGDLPSNEEGGTSSSVFARVKRHAQAGASTEVDRYIADGIISDLEDPLQYWKTHQWRFPNLAILARKYLCVPATSGGVERVFSIAGSLGRARRARLTIKTMGNLLLFREFGEEITVAD